MPKQKPTEQDRAALTVEKAKIALDIAKGVHDLAMKHLLKITELKTEGSKTENWNFFKTTTKGVLNRNVDAEELDRLSEAKKIPEGLLSKIIKWKPELIVTEYKKLDKKELKIAAKFVTEKPGKSNVAVERLKDKK